MNLIKHKNHIAISLFYCCLGLSVYLTYGIIDNIQESLEQQNNIPHNSLTLNLNDVYTTQNLNLELPLWAKAIWKCVNLVWCLFVGCLIYGKIKWD